VTDTDQHAPVLNPWLPMAVVMAGTIMVVLDSTIVNVGLHQIGVELHAGAGIEWVVSAYLLAVCASQPVTGWLADRFGRKRMFLLSLAAFTAASVACAASPNLGILVLARVAQGLGGGALLPVGMAMILELFPKSRHGRAVAVWGMAIMVAPAVGPTVGGWLVTSVSWHWMFLVNLPIGVGSVLFGLRLLPEVGHREHRPFDTLGLLLGSGGLSVTVLGLSEANAWHWRSASTIACLALGVGMLLGFVAHELRTEHPMIQLRMFREQAFRLAMGAMLFVTMGHFVRLVFLPLQLESLRGFSAMKVGMLFFPAAVVTAFAMNAGGRLVDRIGPRRPILAGTAFIFVAMIGFSRLSLTTPVALIIVLMGLQGIGVGLMNAPAMVAGLSELPPNLVSQGTAMRSLTSQVAGAIAVAAFGAVVSGRMGVDPTPAHAQAAYNAAFAAAAACIVVAFLLALRLPDRVTHTEELEEALALAGE
jgi:EmrB/QacA subfamily drug resistance transporter